MLPLLHLQLKKKSQNFSHSLSQYVDEQMISEKLVNARVPHTHWKSKSLYMWDIAYYILMPNETYNKVRDARPTIDSGEPCRIWSVKFLSSMDQNRYVILWLVWTSTPLRCYNKESILKFSKFDFTQTRHELKKGVE